MPTIEELCGWIPMPQEVENVVGNKDVSTEAPHLMRGDAVWDGTSDIPLWEHCIKVTGANLPAHKQTIGDCVSHGNGAGCDYTQCIQISLGKFAGEYIVGQHDCYTEAIYGNMREGKGMGNSDGAVGIWAVNSLVKDGYPQRKGRTYDGSKAKAWGNRGTPSEIKAEGSGFKLTSFVKVKTTNEATNFLWNGYVIPICSNQGFTMVRNQDGICEASGSWAHCMLCIGMIVINGQKIYIILQSWGSNVPSGPTIKNMPNNAFGCREPVFQRILNAGDSYALSSIPGFPAQPANLFV